MVLVAMAVIMIVGVAVGVGVAMGVIGVGADAGDMQVVPSLGLSDRFFVAHDLFAIFAKLAIHAGFAAQDFIDPFGEGIEHERMVFQIVGLEEGNAGMLGGDLVGLAVDAFD